MQTELGLHVIAVPAELGDGSNCSCDTPRSVPPPECKIPLPVGFSELASETADLFASYSSSPREMPTGTNAASIAEAMAEKVRMLLLDDSEDEAHVSNPTAMAEKVRIMLLDDSEDEAHTGNPTATASTEACSAADASDADYRDGGYPYWWAPNQPMPQNSSFHTMGTTRTRLRSTAQMFVPAAACPAKQHQQQHQHQQRHQCLEEWPPEPLHHMEARQPPHLDTRVRAPRAARMRPRARGCGGRGRGARGRGSAWFMEMPEAWKEKRATKENDDGRSMPGPCNAYFAESVLVPHRSTTKTLDGDLSTSGDGARTQSQSTVYQ